MSAQKKYSRPDYVFVGADGTLNTKLVFILGISIAIILAFSIAGRSSTSHQSSPRTNVSQTAD